ncbi:hypothetical protein METH_16785 [Leisingera methylohalidivorans DSM 14336]|uniref:Uncharacterized protein n=1 Tax=Leisingera methylohalidivorans DSM 14336 TaxID=999552 RepID=V9VZI6_9RHOB|nr:hypothetical protein METH_16785 [Leisingera methylohalidivorans DSM 14336]
MVVIPFMVDGSSPGFYNNPVWHIDAAGEREPLHHIDFLRGSKGAYLSPSPETE